MRRYLLTLILFILSVIGYAQHPLIKGTVVDTLGHDRLQNASITLIRASDSILCTFTRSAADGSFTLHPDSPGTYILLLTYPTYADFRDITSVKDGQSLDLGSIPMATKAHMLEEFVLRKKQSAITIKGDTTEYAADSFKVEEGATVDALLKRLPGIEVDRNGSIKAQGERVQKVLVDGEEFFSDDPGLVTQSLQAKTIDAVQVYDKKSDAAIATGIDDGERQKTINLKLKENMKKGYFGRITGGAGTDKYFEEQAMINAFKGKRQISVFGLVSNTAKAGPAWGDSKFTGGSNLIMSEDDLGNMFADNPSGTGQYAGDGLPNTWAGGLHYANKWDEGKEHFSANYKYSKQNVDALNNTFTQYILPDSQYFSRWHIESFRSNDKHTGDAMLELKIDSFSTIEAIINVGTNHSITNSTAYTQTIGGDGALINSSNSRNSNDASSQNIISNISYNRSFAKKGRLLYIQLQENYKKSDGSGYLFSDNHFFTGTPLDDSINQLKTSLTNRLSFYSNLSYTEPLSKKVFLNVAYRAKTSGISSDRFSFDRSGNEWNNSPDSLYSSSYQYNVTTHSGSTAINVRDDKYYLTIGADVFHTIFNQKDLLHDTTVIRSYNNFSPMAHIRWDANKSTSIFVDYDGRTQQPTLDQIQPLRQNSPLNISIGNPELRQSFTNFISFGINTHKVIKGRWLYINSQYSTIHDDIIQTQYTDELGRGTYRYININGNYSVRSYLSANQAFKRGDFKLGIFLNPVIEHSNNYINNVLNKSTNNTYTVSFTFDKQWMKNNKEVASIRLYPGITYNDNHSTISNLATSYFSSDISGDFHIDLPWKLSINSSIHANFRQRTAGFDRNNNVIRWDASISRKLLKGDVMEARLSAFDILDQNMGYSRYSNNNYISENNYNTIRRYALLSIIWNINHSGDKTQSK